MSFIPQKEGEQGKGKKRKEEEEEEKSEQESKRESARRVEIERSAIVGHVQGCVAHTHSSVAVATCRSSGTYVHSLTFLTAEAVAAADAWPSKQNVNVNTSSALPVSFSASSPASPGACSAAVELTVPPAPPLPVVVDTKETRSRGTSTLV